MHSLYDAWAYVQLTRPQNASGSIITYSIGYVLATSSLQANFFIGLLILLALHSLATVHNDIEDFDIDRANKRKSALQDESLSRARARVFVWGLGFISIALALLSSHPVLNIGVITGSLLITWLYNSNPIRASKKPLSSIALMGFCYGTLPFAYGYFIGGGHLHDRFLALAGLLFLARVSTSIMKDYKDVTGDKRSAKQTFYVRYGRTTTARASLLTAILAYTGLLLVVATLKSKNAWFFVALCLGGLLALRAVLLRLQLLKTTKEARLNAIFHQSILSHNQFEAAVLVCLILS